MPPPLELVAFAELPEIVLLISVTPPPKIPPPTALSPLTELPETVLLIIFNMLDAPRVIPPPELLKEQLQELPVTAQLMRFSVPPLLMPPALQRPSPLSLPLETVNP